MTLIDIPTERVVAGAAATLSFQGVDQYGEAADPGTVTVGITRSDGTELVASATATTGTGTSARTVALTATQTAQLDRLTATWTVSGTVVGVTYVETVGGVYVSQTFAALLEPTLAAGQTLAPVFRQARTEVEQMFEDYCCRAFVPRFAVERLDGNGGDSLTLHYWHLRRVRWCNITSGTTTTALTADELAEIPANFEGFARWAQGWPCGRNNIEIGYEHGENEPPADLKRRAVHAIRSQTNTFTSGVADRAISFQPTDGGNVVIATPGLGPWLTGIPTIDEATKRYKLRRPVMF